MATVYISHSAKDDALAKQIRQAILAAGHSVSGALELAPAVDWRSVLENNMRDADIVLVLITEASLQSKYTLAEIGAARAYALTGPRKWLLPVVVGPIDIPEVVADIQAARLEGSDDAEGMTRLLASIEFLDALKNAQENQVREVRERIEGSATAYVEEAMASLSQRERGHSRASLLWHLGGFAAMLAGSVAAVILLSSPKPISTSFDWSLLHSGLKGIVIIGLLVALSKYCFSLGKSHMSESLRNANRIHAISFGRFYLQAYGEHATWNELKEVFQNWNIDTTSAFANISASDYDPRLLEMAVAATQIAMGKEKPKAT